MIAEQIPTDTLVMRDLAVEYLLDYEWSVFPVCSPVPGTDRCFEQHMLRGNPMQRESCKSPGKTPLVKWGQFQDHTPTEQEVRGWWRRWPQANIGCATGAASGFSVVDLDGELAIATAEQRGYHPGPWAYTGRVGGRHLYFAHRDDAPTIFAKQGGIDFRGHGGYVLLPGSLHHTGRRYRWGEAPERGDPLPPLPRWVDAMAGTRADESERLSSTVDIGALLGQNIPEGERDETFFRVAAKLRGADVPYDLALALVEQLAAGCVPPPRPGRAKEKVDNAYQRYDPNPPNHRAHLKNGAVTLQDAANAEVAASAPEPFLRPISALLALEEVPTDWLVEDLFSAGSSGWVGGEPKVRKSWLTLELIRCLTTGQPFLGRFTVPRPRRVIYIQEEDPEQRVLRRLRKLIRGAPDAPVPTDDQLRYAVRSGFKLDNPQWIARLRAELQGWPADICVLDVFQKLHLKDENSQEQMSQVIEALASLSREFGVAFIVVHHFRKASLGGSQRGNQMLRGSSVLGGFAECSLYLKQGKGKNHFTVEPEVKDAPELENFGVHMVDTDDGGVRLEHEVLSGDERDQDREQKVYAFIVLCDETGRDCRTEDVATELNLSRESARKTLKALSEKGQITEDVGYVGRTRYASWRLLSGVTA